MLTMNELFSGIGAQSAALKRLGIEFEVVGIAEIDKYAIASYEAIHGKARNYGDISKIEKLDYADFWTYSFPCQDISVAGKQAGIEKHTRSGLLYEVERLLNVSAEHDELPKYLMLENVKNLVGKKFKEQFDEWLQTLEELGYNNYWKVLNAKNYGIPQNRERVFAISIRKDIDTGDFSFPEGFDNGLRLKDFLEDEVDEKFYISKDKVEKLISQLNKGKGMKNVDEPSGVYLHDSLRFSKDALDGASRCLKAEKIDSAVVIPCITPDREEKRQNGRRFKEDGEPMFTLTGQDRHGILIDDQGRTKKKLTLKRECPTLRAQSHGNEPKVLQIGNIVDTGNWNNPQRGRIYSAEGCSPSLNTVGGGGLEPKIVQKVGDRGTSNYSVKDISNTIPANAMSDRGQLLIEPKQDFTGSPLNFQNCPNYSSCEFAMTCEHSNSCVMQEGDRQPKIAVKEATKQGYAIAEEGDSINIQFPNSETRRGRVGKGVAQTLETSCNQAIIDVKPRKDIKELEKHCEYCGEKLERKRFNGRLEDFGVFNNRKYCDRECMRRAFVMVGENGQSWSTAHATARKINELFLQKDSCEICGGTQNLDIHHIDGNWQNNELSNLMCLCRSCHTKYEKNKNKECGYRIRKLTPRETWRLMGFTDEEFSKAEAVNSNSQLYKQAGNSIVVDVLEYIFRNLLK